MAVACWRRATNVDVQSWSSNHGSLLAEPNMVHARASAELVTLPILSSGNGELEIRAAVRDPEPSRDQRQWLLKRIDKRGLGASGRSGEALNWLVAGCDIVGP